MRRPWGRGLKDRPFRPPGTAGLEASVQRFPPSLFWSPQKEMERNTGGARFARFLRKRLEAAGRRLQVADPVRLALPLAASAVGLRRNRSCRPIALGAGFPGCFRPRAVGRPAAAWSLAPATFLASRLGTLAYLGRKPRALPWRVRPPP